MGNTIDIASLFAGGIAVRGWRRHHRRAGRRGRLRPRSWSACHQVSAIVAVIGSFCEEVSAYYAAACTGRYTDAEVDEIAGRVGRFVADLEALAVELCRQDGP